MSDYVSNSKIGDERLKKLIKKYLKSEKPTYDTMYLELNGLFTHTKTYNEPFSPDGCIL